MRYIVVAVLAAVAAVAWAADHGTGKFDLGAFKGGFPAGGGGFDRPAPAGGGGFDMQVANGSSEAATAAPRAE
jgi:hypothetical protein